MSDRSSIADSEPILTLSSLVHELRQPLFAIRGRLQLLARPGATVRPEQLTELVGQLDHIESLLDHYGDGHLPRGGQFDVRVPVSEALTMCAPRAEAAGVLICADLPDKPVLVAGPAIALRQILANLLGNAIDAVSPARVREIVVRLEVAEEVEITIADSGVGVPAELRDQLFEPFVTTKPPGEGTGLGLFIAQRRARELGGQLTIEPDPGGGTRARVTLPRVSAPAATPGSSDT